jgi:HAD superfamily hydrolase (TIGR01509 family)
MTRALIFDCDGVLADTEQFAHLPAFNRMWRELGVPWQWSVEQYGVKLKIGGGKERMASLAKDADFRAAFDVPADEADWKAIIAEWHKRKTAIYTGMIASGDIPPRSGVKRLAEAALAHGWKLAVASTSAQDSVEAVLRRAMGETTAAQCLVLAGDVVKAKKPAPDIYLLASEQLGIAAQDCVVVEDSRNGLLAAYAAGMPCVVTVSGYTRKEDFSEAAIVLTCLGDPDGEQCAVLANRTSAAPGAYMTFEDLERIKG